MRAHKLSSLNMKLPKIITHLIFAAIFVTTFTSLYFTMKRATMGDGVYRNIMNTNRSFERNNIVFLKTHKCASSTVQNILLRYGYSRGLDFVLPTETNYLGHPERFSRCMISRDVRTESNKYNIFTHHTRFNYTSIKEIMHNDTVFVTMLRNPVELFESIYSYYSLHVMYQGTIFEVIKNPSLYKLQNVRYMSKIGINQMSYDLGLSKKYFEKNEDVKKFIEVVDKQFDLVMISEFVEASLVLLSKLMNWPLTNVQFLPINVRTNNKRTKLSLTDKQRLMNINSADTQLYQFFLTKFRKIVINDYGIDKMITDVKTLINLNERLFSECVKQLNEKGYANTKSYDIKDDNVWLCKYATKNELNFTMDVRNIQKLRVKAVRKLKTFLHGQNY